MINHVLITAYTLYLVRDYWVNRDWVELCIRFLQRFTSEKCCVR